jgi:hypothetical protein
VTWPDRQFEAAGAAHRSWRIVEPLEPCHALVVPLDTGSRIVGALVILRCRSDSQPYAEEDVDRFRLAGMRVAARFESDDGLPNS